MIYFVSFIRNEQSSYVKYEGMDQQAIQDLLVSIGADRINFIDEKAFQSGFESLAEARLAQPVIEPSISLEDRVSALEAKVDALINGK